MAKNDRHPFPLVFLTGSLGLLTALSLVPTGLKPNLLGNVGSSAAFFLYSSFGLCAWAFPAVLALFTYLRIRDISIAQPGLKLLGLLLALASLCVSFHTLFPGVQMFAPAQMREGVEWGGKLGQVAGERMQMVLTRFGTMVICLLALALSAWFLETEDHLVRAAQGVWEGFGRAARWFEEHGLEVFALLKEKADKALEDWKTRNRAKRLADEARKKLETPKPLQRPARPQVTLPDPKPASVSAGIGALPKPVKSPKPEAKPGRFFTGEAEPFEPEPSTLRESSFSPETASPAPEEEEDLVSIAMAEAKAKDPLTLRKKMEAANIEIAGEEEEEHGEPAKPTRVIRQWQLPNLHILKSAEESREKPEDDFEGVSRVLQETLKNFGVEAGVVGVNPGPTVTQYEVQPAAGVKITRIASLADDLALALKCGQVRVVAPIPGKATVGVEVPNSKGRVVTLKELIGQEEFLASGKKLLVALGKDIAGAGVYAGIKEMPHVLIAGATGSGKSVCVNTLIASLIFKYTPEELRLVLIDPKRVEMYIYQDLPHLALKVVNDPKEANGAFKWLVREMEERYEMLAHAGARDIDSYNLKIQQKREAGETDRYPMYYIVVLVDELADLMMVAKDQVEDSITRLAQMARAVGIHLVLATQRPSVEVITGIIKANFPSRIAFQVFSKVDSRTILDMNGADALLGRGDMLYLPPGAPKPLRLQGAYVTLEEIERLVDFWKSQGGPQYSADIAASKSRDLVTEESEDELYGQAVEIVLRAKQASTSLLQRRLKVGYSRAARLLDDMEVRGVVGPADGNKPRKILVPNAGGAEPSMGEDEENPDEQTD